MKEAIWRRGYEIGMNERKYDNNMKEENVVSHDGPIRTEETMILTRQYNNDVKAWLKNENTDY